MADPISPGEIAGIQLTAKSLLDLSPPQFSCVAAERRHRQERLAGALRIFGRLGFGDRPTLLGQINSDQGHGSSGARLREGFVAGGPGQHRFKRFRAVQEITLGIVHADLPEPFQHRSRLHEFRHGG